MIVKTQESGIVISVMKKVLVTGANGYIGQRLVMSLLAQGYKVVCVVRDLSRFDTKRLLNFDPSSYIPDDYIAQENNLRHPDFVRDRGP